MNSVLGCFAGSSQTKYQFQIVIAGIPFRAVGKFRDAGSPLMPKLFSDPEAIAEDIIRDIGDNLVVGLPLGLGKANHVINALYARAAAVVPST